MFRITIFLALCCFLSTAKAQQSSSGLLQSNSSNIKPALLSQSPLLQNSTLNLYKKDSLQISRAAIPGNAGNTVTPSGQNPAADDATSRYHQPVVPSSEQLLPEGNSLLFPTQTPLSHNTLLQSSPPAYHYPGNSGSSAFSSQP